MFKAVLLVLCVFMNMVCDMQKRNICMRSKSQLSHIYGNGCSAVVQIIIYLESHLCSADAGTKFRELALFMVLAVYN